MDQVLPAGAFHMRLHGGRNLQPLVCGRTLPPTEPPGQDNVLFLYVFLRRVPLGPSLPVSVFDREIGAAMSHLYCGSEREQGSRGRVKGTA